MKRKVYYKMGYNYFYVFVLMNGLLVNEIYSFDRTKQGQLQAEIAYLSILNAGH